MSIDDLDCPAWKAGYDARFFGIAEREENPYAEGSEEEQEWEDGWDEADCDCDDE